MNSNLFSSYDLYLFHEGTMYRGYEKFGSHLLKENGMEGVRFTLWAPNAVKVGIAGDFNCWDGKRNLMKKIHPSGIWSVFIPGLKHGHLYKYEIYTKKGQILLKSDPFAFFSEHRPKSASVIYSLEDYKWNDEAWQRDRKSRSVYNEPMNIYEVHLGSWRRKGNGDFLNFREIVHELVDYVLEMGYTHIEILPIMEHPLDDSWGYQVTGFYSVTSRYGTPHDFMYFVDYCHQKGIGVILDWVPAHFCKDGHGLMKFDGLPLYEGEENLQWGTLQFNYSKPEVVSFLISNALFWFDKYHIDGLRIDAVASMLYLDYGKREGQWEPNQFGGNENLEAVAFMKKLNEAVFKYYPQALMIAEESTEWPLVTAPTYLGGLGYNFKWNMGWMNDVLKYMEKDPIYRKWHHNLLTFSLTYAFSENFILPFSHDEVVHGKKSLIEKMPGDYWQKFANLRLLMAYMVTHPGKKLLFMGGEFAQFIEWRFNEELEWHILENEMHQNFHNYIKKLNHFYLSEKALWENDQSWEGFKWIEPDNSSQSILIFTRHSLDPQDFLLVILNFTPTYYEDFRIGVPASGYYQEIFNSDLSLFGGSNQKNSMLIETENTKWHNQPYSLNLKIPPLAALFLKKDR